MSKRQKNTREKLRKGIEELQEIVSSHYPSATFRISEGEGSRRTYLYGTVDLDDTEEVTDKVIDRLVSLQVDEGLPLFFVALSTPERVARQWEEIIRERGWPPRMRTVTEGLP